ncbi:MAG: ATP-binding protein [Candidatus Omnitrophota bacterium]
MKFTFSHRITLGLLVMAVLLIIVGALAFITTKDVQGVSRSIMKENVSSLKAAEELELALLNQKGIVASYFLDGNSTWFRTLEDRKKDFDSWFKKAQEVALTDHEKKILQDVSVLYKTYDRQRNKAIQLYRSGNTTEAKNVLLNDMKISIDALYQKCEDLILANEILIAKAEVTSQGNVIRMTSLIWSMILITLILGSMMGFFISRKINEQLVRAAKLASLGQLSANVAHEIRNPLTSIKMRLYSLKKELKQDSALSEDLNVINEEINRMEGTVNNFLDFARPPELNLQSAEIGQILEGTVNLIAPKARSQNITIQKQLHDVPLEFKIDKEQIRQVFLNIMLNAIEAMPSGGTLKIDATKSEDKKSNKVLEINICDTGIGIPLEIKNKITEPFFTTKTEGTGLGLFIASRIVKMHKGSLDIDSHNGKGTTVTLRIPVV